MQIKSAFRRSQSRILDGCHDFAPNITRLTLIINWQKPTVGGKKRHFHVAKMFYCTATCRAGSAVAGDGGSAEGSSLLARAETTSTCGFVQLKNVTRLTFLCLVKYHIIVLRFLILNCMPPIGRDIVKSNIIKKPSYQHLN